MESTLVANLFKNSLLIVGVAFMFIGLFLYIASFLENEYYRDIQQGIAGVFMWMAFILVFLAKCLP